MNKRELAQAINKIVTLRVEKEVNKRIESIKSQIIAEVAGMLQYSERKILSELSLKDTLNTTPLNLNDLGTGAPPPYHPSTTSGRGGSDFNRVMDNLSTMEGFNDRTEKIKKRFTGDGMLNDILNDTTEFNKGETQGVGTSLADLVGGNVNMETQYEEPWQQPLAQSMPQQPQQPQIIESRIPTTGKIMGIDNKPVDLANPAVQGVLNVLQNTNFKEKYQQISEAGNMFRDGFGASGNIAPKFNSKYFKDQMID